MADNQDQELDRTPRFSRAILGRIIAVLLFVALGTFAVVQMIRSNGDPDSSKPGDGDNAAVVKAGQEDSNAKKGATTPPNSLAKDPSKLKPPINAAKSGFNNSFAKSPVNSLSGSKKTANSFGAPPPASKTAKTTQPPVNKATTKTPPTRFAQLPDKGPLMGSKNGFVAAPKSNNSDIMNAFDATANQAKKDTQKLGNSINNSASKLLQDAKSTTNSTAKNLVNSLPILKQPNPTGSKSTASSKPPTQPPIRPGTNSSFGSGNTSSSTFGGKPNSFATPNPSKSSGFDSNKVPTIKAPSAATSRSTASNTKPPATQPPSMKAPAPANSNFGSSPLSTSKTGMGGTDFQAGLGNVKPQNAPPPLRTPVMTSQSKPGQNPQIRSSSTPPPSTAGVNNTFKGNNGVSNTFKGTAGVNNQPKPPTNPNFSSSRPNAMLSPTTNNSAFGSTPQTKSPGSMPNSRSGMPPASRASNTRSTVPSYQASSSTLGSRSSGLGASMVATGAAINAPTKDIPGDRQLEGVQAPALTVEKLSPREIQVNQSAEFEIVVRNVGRVTANDVNVHDQVPAGTDFQGSSPQPTSLTQDRKVKWSIGTLRPGQEKRIKIQLKPTRPGEIGSVAHVTFATQASMRTLVTKPVLEIVHRTNPKVLLGDNVIFEVVVQNKGDGPAKNVVIQEDVPRQLEFQEGYRELEYEIGTLLPGQSKTIRLGLKAAEVGRIQNIMFASAEGGLRAKHQIDMEVIAPNLVAQSQGPTRRFIKREVAHQFTVLNQGTALATNVDLIARLPAGLRFVNADKRGRYDSNSHAVYWSLAELGLNVDATVNLTTLPVDAGNQDIKFEAAADLNQQSSVVQKLSVEHLVDVFFSIDDLVDPIEVGSNTHYRVRIVNQGTSTATHVQLKVDFPMGLTPLSVEGSLQNQIQGQSIVFAPINSLNPGEELMLIVHAKGDVAGDHRVVVNMQADGRNAPVSKEETTHVYSDR